MTVLRAAGGRRSTSPARALAAATALVAVLATSGTAQAWCRTASCPDGVGSSCSPALPTDCGEPLSWGTRCLGYSLQEDGTAMAPLERVRELVALGFSQWTAADCGGAAPGLAVVEMGDVACDAAEFDTSGPNANVIVFRDASWPYSARALALTTVTYGLDDAIIRDADIEVNSASIDFTFDDTSPQYDFQSIITHELGHFLGLAHSTVCDVHGSDACADDDVPTMILSYDKGSTLLRSLATDDAAGICEVYPPAELDACEPRVTGGLVDECGDAGSNGLPDTDEGEEGGCCAVAPGRPRGSDAPAAVALALGLGATALRRARRRRA